MTWSEVKVIAFALISAGAVACTGEGTPCMADEDCRSGGRCDVATGVCVLPQDASTSCDPACGSWEFCELGACAGRYSNLEITSPRGTRDGGPITARALLVRRASAEPNPPTSLDFSVRRPDGGQVSSGQLNPSGAEFTATLSPLADGEYLFTATWPEASMSSSSSFAVDSTAPAFTLSVPARDAGAPTATTSFTDPEPGFAGAWRRDQSVVIGVQSPAADVNAQSVVLRLTGTDGGSVVAAVVPASPCDAGFCGNARFDLWAVELNAFRANLTVSVQGSDLAGNGGQSSASIPVTRHRWAYDAGTVGALSPAVSRLDGLVVVPVGAFSDVIAGVRPDGHESWRVATGRVRAGLAIGETDAGAAYAFVATEQSATAALYAISLEDGGVAARCPPTGAVAGATTPGSVAVIHTDADSASHVTGAVVLAGTGQTLFIRPTAITGCGTLGSSLVAPVARSALVARSGALFYGATDLTAARIPYATTADAGFPVNANTLIFNLAISGSNLAGGGGGLSFNQGGLLRIPLVGEGSEQVFPQSPSSRVHTVVIDGAGRALVGNETSTTSGNLTLVDFSSGAVFKTAADAGVIRGTPILGTGYNFYFAESEGAGLLTSMMGQSFSARWSVAGVGQVEAPLTLDCPRNPAGGIVAGRPGPLYVMSTNGILYSFVSDSRGMDTTAAWPKWQRDPHNSGNGDGPLSPFACGP